MQAAGKYVLAALLVAIAAHFAIVTAVPSFFMNTAIDRLSAKGAHLNTWQRAPRVSENSRTIVRPSPDLQYSACPYDLSKGPLTIRVDAWPSYWSLSLYAANSDNFFIIDDREAHDGVTITLVRAGHTAPDHAARVVESPTDRGIALVRRLAPTQSDFDAATQASQADVCQHLS